MDTPLTQEQIREFVIPAHGNLEKVKQMLTEEPRFLNACYEEWGETGLGAASHVGNRPIAEFLLMQGATPTIFAAAMLGRREEVTRFLDEAPTLLNSGGAHNIPLLFHAALSGDIALLDLLVARGNTQRADSALHIAAARDDVRLAQWLLNHGADPAAKNFQEKTALEVAEEGESTAVADLLKRVTG